MTGPCMRFVHILNYSTQVISEEKCHIKRFWKWVFIPFNFFFFLPGEVMLLPLFNSVCFTLIQLDSIDLLCMADII